MTPESQSIYYATRALLVLVQKVMQDSHHQDRIVDVGTTHGPSRALEPRIQDLWA